MTIPKVSVVCPIYNRADYIRDTIDSLLGQDLDSFEIVLVNDGSPDPRVRDILDSYNDSRLKVVHQANTGFTLAICRAIEMSRAPFIAIQGAGDVSLPSRLRLQLDALKSEPDAAIAGCHYRVRNTLDGAVSEIAPRPPAKGTIIFERLSHGELMYRRSVYDAVKGYRTVFNVGQGSDLWMRMMREHTAVIVPSVEYEQRYFSDGVSLSPVKRAMRHAMNAVRIENERLFQKTGFDHIDSYGAGAFGMLGGSWTVRRETARAILGLGSPGKDAYRPRIEADALTRGIVVLLRIYRAFRVRKTDFTR